MKKEKLQLQTGDEELDGRGSGLGEFKECLAQSKDPFTWPYVVLLVIFLLPWIMGTGKIIMNSHGQIQNLKESMGAIGFLSLITVIPALVVIFYWYYRHTHGYRLFLFSKGFVVQKMKSQTKVRWEEIYPFERIESLLLRKEIIYSYRRGVQRYLATQLELYVRFKDFEEDVAFKEKVRNQFDNIKKYIFIEWACHDILKAWTDYKLPLVLDEIRRNGIATFGVPGFGHIDVGPNFVSANGIKMPADVLIVRERGSKLTFIPDEVFDFDAIEVDLSDMPNSTVFMALLRDVLHLNFEKPRKGWRKWFGL